MIASSLAILLFSSLMLSYSCLFSSKILSILYIVPSNFKFYIWISTTRSKALFAIILTVDFARSPFRFNRDAELTVSEIVSKYAADSL